MEAYDLFSRIRKTPRKLELVTESNTPEEIKLLLELDCDDLAEEIFWIAKAYLTYNEL